MKHLGYNSLRILIALTSTLVVSVTVEGTSVGGLGRITVADYPKSSDVPTLHPCSRMRIAETLRQFYRICTYTTHYLLTLMTHLLCAMGILILMNFDLLLIIIFNY